MSSKYVFALPLLLSTCVLANEKALWSGEIDLGFENLTGNTEEQSIAGEVELVRENQPWKWVNNAKMLYDESSNIRTAEKYDLSTYLSYHFKEKYYSFGRAVYETDKFSGFDYQTNYTLGLGWDIYHLESVKWNAEIGAGFRSSVVENSSTNEDEDEAIGTISTTFDWQFAENASIKQYVSLEVGSEITITYSNTELTIKMIDNLAFKLSYNLKHTSSVPVDTEKLDTETLVSLNYQF